MDERLDLVGEMLVLLWHGQGHLQRQFERERLTGWLDGAEGDGSLKAVGGTHGVSPYWYWYWYYGGPSCVLFNRWTGILATPARNPAGNHSPYLAHPPPHRAPTGERQEIKVGARQLVRGHRPAGAAPSGTRGGHTPVLAHQLASARK